MQRKKIVIANWKAYVGSVQEAKELFAATKRTAGRMKRTSVVVCPSFPHLALFAKMQTSQCRLGAQDVSLAELGAHTGEVTAPILADLGAKLCIVGHSERRRLGETNAMVAHKIKLLLKAGITPVICIGERERDGEGAFLSELEAQLRESLRGLPRAQLPRIIIAYEPVWAIGKSAAKAMSPRDVHETVLFIRKILSALYGHKSALAVPVLYGGSVEPGNIAALARDTGVAGFLVGRAGIEAKPFTELLRTLDTV